VHYSVNAIGGVRRDLTEELAAELRASLPKFQALSDFVVDALGGSGPLGSKVAGYGALSGADALALGAVGPTLRGSGVDSDVRREDRYAAYGDTDFDVVVESDGDVRARFMVRARETRESVRIVGQLLAGLPAGPILGDLKEPNLKERREVIGRVEAPRGELIYYIRSNGTNVPERVKVRTPTFANLCFLTRALKGEPTGRARAIIESIDPCLSCTDR
jgi:Ni,Fe-hydrogenase III large subunit